jgi:hypothetical protein
MSQYSFKDIDEAVAYEIGRQNAKWGEQNHEDGTGAPVQKKDAEDLRALCDMMFDIRQGTWRHILAEEVAEAFAESDPDLLKSELIQVIAVAKQWIMAIERRRAL